MREVGYGLASAAATALWVVCLLMATRVFDSEKHRFAVLLALGAIAALLAIAWREK